MKSTFAKNKIAFRSNKRTSNNILGPRLKNAKREAIHVLRKTIKEGFECKKLGKIAFDKFEKFKLNFSKLSSVTVTVNVSHLRCRDFLTYHVSQIH